MRDAGASGNTLWQRSARRHVSIHHEVNERLERSGRRPAQELARLGGVAEQEVDLGGPEVGRVDFDPLDAGGRIHANFVDALSLPDQLDAGAGKGQFCELGRSRYAQ